jgi:hypothetical protein
MPTYALCKHLAKALVWPLSGTFKLEILFLTILTNRIFFLQAWNRNRPTSTYPNPHQHKSTLQHLNTHRTDRIIRSLLSRSHYHEIQNIYPPNVTHRTSLLLLLSRSLRVGPFDWREPRQFYFDTYFRERNRQG